MSHKLNKLWDVLPAEYKKDGADPAEMALAYIEYQKAVIGRLTHAFTGASEAILHGGKKSPADEVAQTIEDLWNRKEELERKQSLHEREKKELTALLAALQQSNAENTKRLQQLRQFASSMKSLTGSTVQVSVLVEIAEDVLNKTA